MSDLNLDELPYKFEASQKKLKIAIEALNKIAEEKNENDIYTWGAAIALIAIEKMAEII